MKHFLVACVVVTFLATRYAPAQQIIPCSYPGGDCAKSVPMPVGTNTNACMTSTNFNATLFLDSCTNGLPPCASYNDAWNGLPSDTVSMYGSYGNLEGSSHAAAVAQNHYALGRTVASNIKPLCMNGLPPNGTCSEGGVGKIVFLALGFSNCDIEMCGGWRCVLPTTKS